MSEGRRGALGWVAAMILVLGCGPGLEGSDPSGEDEGGSGGEVDEVVVCESMALPEPLGSGTNGSSSFQPTVPSVLAHPSGAVWFAPEGEPPAIAPPSQPAVQEPELTETYDSEASPSGRWLVLRKVDNAVRITDFEQTFDLAFERHARVGYYADPQGEEAVLLVADRMVAITAEGPVDLGEGTDQFEVSAAGAMAVTEDPAGHRVVDLATGTVRDLGRGDGTVEITRDGRFVTFEPGRVTDSAAGTMTVIDTAGLDTVAEIPYQPDELGYYRAPWAVPETDHTFAVARPGGGFTVFNEDASLTEWTRGEPLAMLGDRYALVTLGSALELVDWRSGEVVTLPGIRQTAGVPTDGSYPVVSPRGRAYAVTISPGPTPCVVVADTTSFSLTSLRCAESEHSGISALWVGDDGRTLVANWEEGAQVLELYRPDGEVEWALQPDVAILEVLAQRGDLLWLAGSGNAAIIEVDLAARDHRVVATGDVFDLSVPADGCTAAVALGCTRSSEVPDSGPIVDWEIHRVPLGSDHPPIEGCTG